MVRNAWLGAVLLCAACANTPLTPRSGAAGPDAAPARLVVYWPADSQVVRLSDKPEVTLNNQRIGSFAMGGEVARDSLMPGVYRMAIRRPATAAPNKDLASFDLSLEPGQTLYIRYTDEPVGQASSVETISARVRIAIVDAETGAARR